MNDYDPKTCVTAGCLRSIGWPIPEEIPDCGWVPWTSMQVIDVSLHDDGMGFVSVQFTTPFKWVTGIYSINTKGEGAAK